MERDENAEIEAARRGDPEAVRALVRTHYPGVLRFLTTLCDNAADAEDLAQESFVRALRGLRGFRAESGLRTWLHRIAYREFVRSRRRHHSTLELPEAVPSPLFEPGSLLALDLERALRCLAPDSRAAFVLCEVQGLTMREAAEVMGVPPGTAKSRLHTARTRLQLLLEPQEEPTHAL